MNEQEMKHFQDQVFEAFNTGAPDEALNQIADRFPNYLDDYLAGQDYLSNDAFFHKLKIRLKDLVQACYKDDDFEKVVWRIKNIANKLDVSSKSQRNGVTLWNTQGGLTSARPMETSDLDTIIESLAKRERADIATGQVKMSKLKYYFQALLQGKTCDPAVDYLMDRFGEDYVGGMMDGLGIMAGQDGNAILDIYLQKCGERADKHAYRVANEKIDELSRSREHYIFVDIYDDDTASGFKTPNVRRLQADDCWQLWDMILRENEPILMHPAQASSDLDM